MDKKYLTGSTKANVELNEVQQGKIPLHSETTIEPALIGSNSEPIEKPLRRSGRVPCQSDKYFDFLVHDDDLVELDENDEDPITYMDALLADCRICQF